MPLYFEDIEVGFTYATPKQSVFEADIVNFVALAGLYEDLFCNLEYIENESIFKGRFAPAALTWAMAQGLTTRTGLYEKTFVAILGVDRMRFVQPVRVGDTLHVEVEVLSRRETSKGDRGVLNSLFQVKNQKGETVMQYEMQQMVLKRETQAT
jgi:acyl dehydratase